ncbi:riboflavin synthase [Aquibaculum arenosum]|uniref:Riboflavin synthase n=1 Tax=Aquibaculum arenosum TaxID=3032591 RepID=A0ABT5YK61_9PROT|nr:riboflavin synthase [Fodinicurvata sp. CAU 1616]MDF2095216.1 riboflavin synthase [Fodinicurvata sp. CAU 1616]
MFTGIITDLGEVLEADAKAGGDLRLLLQTAWDTAEVPLGASVACNGVCLTVVERGPQRLAFDVSAETLSKTTLDTWQAGQRINLERSLRLGDELGGHLVYGHVDGLAEVLDIRREGESHRYRFRADPALLRFLAPKGSIALDGVSLTVNEVDGEAFGVNIIPHTSEVTTFGAYRPGNRVNLEIDMLARYVARLLPKPE